MARAQYNRPVRQRALASSMSTARPRHQDRVTTHRADHRCVAPINCAGRVRPCTGTGTGTPTHPAKGPRKLHVGGTTSAYHPVQRIPGAEPLMSLDMPHDHGGYRLRNEVGAERCASDSASCKQRRDAHSHVSAEPGKLARRRVCTVAWRGPSRAKSAGELRPFSAVLRHQASANRPVTLCRSERPAGKGP